MKKDENGNFIKQKVKASLHITGRVGDYVTSKELHESLEKFADYMGGIILNSISIIAKDEFVVKNITLCNLLLFEILGIDSIKFFSHLNKKREDI